MGRPRKNRDVPAQTVSPVEGPKPTSSNEAPTVATAATMLPDMFPDFEFDSTIGMDLDFSFLDMSNSDVNFLNLINSDSELPSLTTSSATGQSVDSLVKTSEHAGDTPRAFWAMDNHLDAINFDMPPSPAAPSQGPEITPEEVNQIMSYELPETLPSLSPPSSSSPATDTSPPEQQESTQTCNCLSRLYLALDSLQRLPKEVARAMNVARTAAKAAHDSILCSECGNPPVEACGGSVPINSLQTMLMLGALLPSLSNAYTRIIAMVDAEATAADREGRKIPFTLSGYGGLWGWMAAQGAAKCGMAKWLEGSELEPLLWRLTVRALLKMDVYGVNELTPGVNSTDARQPGLKNIIQMMEERQRRRHELVDQLVASGALPRPPAEYTPLSATGEKPTCLKIIDIAKRSMDDLVIP